MKTSSENYEKEADKSWKEITDQQTVYDLNLYNSAVARPNFMALIY